ncbi:MAG: class I SAM-dependent methyltransferase family protein [Thermoplasmata archaeon]
MRCLCVVVPKAEGENIRKKLSEAGKLRLDARVATDGDNVFFPVTDADGLCYPTLERDMEEASRPKHYTELLDLPPGLMELLPTSFDIVGDIFVLKLIDELLPHANAIAEALLQTSKNAKVVALDGGVKGEYRTRDLRILAGERRTTTVQKEYGLRYGMDLATVYFSPRLATERKRIADMCKPGERVLDMFCGVGPFSIMLAATGKPGSVYSVDLNPEAIKYMVENIKLNKIKNVSPMLGDARVIAPQLPRPDRIIMNLPHSAIDFLDVALGVVNPGGTIHLYMILESDAPEMMERGMLHLAASMKRNLKFSNVHEVHTYSPAQSMFCFDLLIR